MHFSLRSVLALLFSAAVATGACGGNVVVDGTAGASGTGATTTTGFGASTTTVGVSGGTTTGVSTTSVSTTTSTTSSTSSSSSTTSTGTTSSGACTDPLDDKTFTYTVVFPTEVKCALANFSNNAGLNMCLSSLGLTAGCEACVDAELQCSIQHCPTPCSANQGSQQCTSCRKANCESAFVACSGRAHDTGITNCSGVLGNGPWSTPWQFGLDAADFTTQAAQTAYQDFGACACGSSPCAPACAGNYCMGQTASMGCASCIKQNCGMAYATCETN
jgi:hypothetical protein